jgi:hypothetical protein
MLAQDQIDNSIFGHTEFYRNIKRRYVFQILYGLYTLDIARLQEELRLLANRLRRSEQGSVFLETLLLDTPWANRALLEQGLLMASRDLEEYDRRSSAIVSSAPTDSSNLRSRVLVIEEEIAELEQQERRERASIAQMESLIAQLETQSKRLTRAIVAGDHLLDVEFVLCPRCGSSLSSDRVDDGRCYLCLQVPQPSINKEDLIAEQDKIAIQIVEARELISSHLRAVDLMNQSRRDAELRRSAAASELNIRVNSYVSDQAVEIEEIAKARAAAEAEVRRLRDYLTIFERFDASAAEVALLAEQRSILLAELDEASHRQSDAVARISYLENQLEGYPREI